MTGILTRHYVEVYLLPYPEYIGIIGGHQTLGKLGHSFIYYILVNPAASVFDGSASIRRSTADCACAT
jgi:hypothetical protein